MEECTKAGRKNLEERLQEFKETCRERGLKITPQRVAIYRELISSGEHPSAIAVYQRVSHYFPSISLATVSNTLLTFGKIGLANVVEFSGDPKRFDPNLQLHHHFRCTECGKIVDFCSDSYDALEVPPDIKKRFLVFQKKVHLEGLCDTCAAKRAR